MYTGNEEQLRICGAFWERVVMIKIPELISVIEHQGQTSWLILNDKS